MSFEKSDNSINEFRLTSKADVLANAFVERGIQIEIP